jgi:predicted Zn-dependent peptidase
MLYNRTVLENGITVVSEPMDSVRSITLGIWFSVGSRDEAPAEAGMSHFMEHMMFKGTPTKSAKDISEEFDRMGAELNAGTSKEYTMYYARFLDEHLPKAFELLGDMVVNSLCADEECERERKVVIEEIGRMEDNPEDLVGEIFEAALWPDHPIGLPIIGTRETVGSFGHEAAVAFRQKHFITGNVVVAAAGNVNHEELVALSERCLAELPVGPRAPRDLRSPGEQNPVACVERDTEQAHILLGFATMDSRDPDRFPLQIMSDVLGGGMSSRLFQEIREQRGLAYAVQTFPSLHQDTGEFCVYVGTNPDNAELVLGLIRAEFADIAANGVTVEELERAKESAAGHLVLSTEATRTRMVRIGRAEVTDTEVLSAEDVIERLNAVSMDDVKRVALRVLTAPTTLAIVGPFDEAAVTAFASQVPPTAGGGAA